MGLKVKNQQYLCHKLCWKLAQSIRKKFLAMSGLVFDKSFSEEIL